MPLVASFANNSARALGFGGDVPVVPITYIGATIIQDNATVNITLPAGSAAGDLCICINGYNRAIPAGFTLLNTSTMTNNGGQYYTSSFKALVAGDITNGYITVDVASINCGAALVVYRGISSPVFSASGESTTTANNNVTYVSTSGARGVLAFNTDRDGYAAGSTANGGITKLGGIGGTYGLTVGHSLTPIANSTAVGFSNLNTTQAQMTTLITLK